MITRFSDGSFSEVMLAGSYETVLSECSTGSPDRADGGFGTGPEAIAFLFVAHVDPLVGVFAAVIVYLITSLFGGRPG
jgi:MFS superfamily sulfate permease-like transporter